MKYFVNKVETFSTSVGVINNKFTRI